MKGGATRGHVPGRGWVWARRLTQSLALIAIVTAPLLGGWQRQDRSEMALWDNAGWELPVPVRDRLPLGDAPGQAHDALVLRGGGVAVDYVELPVIDPVMGAVALRDSLGSGWFWLALLLPVGLAIVAGRVFCGWFCPFGVLSRALAWGFERLPGKPRRPQIPDRRWLRWGILGGGVVLGILGMHVFLYAFLPHLLVQQSAYAMWLLGGGGAALGLLGGLVLAGLLFGPTTFCASLCPTGAALNLLGRKRLARVTITEPSACGANCTLCDNGCWLQLRPATGDPGPDCDTCTRCFEACPRANMTVVALRKPNRKHLTVVTALALGIGVTAGVGQAEARELVKPRLVLNGELETDEGVTVAAAAVDLNGVKLDPDDRAHLEGIQLSVFVARGERGPADERGLLPERDVYRGPLAVTIESDGAAHRVRFDAPDHPVSTQGTSIYRRTVDVALEPGDAVVVEAIEGWLDRPVRWAVPPRGVAPSWTTAGWTLLGGGLLFAGLLSLALALPTRKG